MAELPLFPTSLVGSFAQPEWLIDRARLAGRFPPRVRAREPWRPAPEHLEQAQNDATLLAIRAQEDAGLTSSPTARSGGRATRTTSPPLSSASTSTTPARRWTAAVIQPGAPGGRPDQPAEPVQVTDVQFLRAHTDHVIKVTVPGPFTMSQQAQDDFYGDSEALAYAYADVVNAEVKDLFAAGADIVQLDEPYLQARPEPARRHGVAALNRALEGVVGTTAVHLCFGYAAIIHDRPSGYSFLPELADCSCDQISIETAQSDLDTSVLQSLDGKTIILGVIDLSDPSVESADAVVARVRKALPYVSAERVVIGTDCGMKYLPWDSAAGKMEAMAEAAYMLRADYS